MPRPAFLKMELRRMALPVPEILTPCPFNPSVLPLNAMVLPAPSSVPPTKVYDASWIPTPCLPLPRGHFPSASSSQPPSLSVPREQESPGRLRYLLITEEHPPPSKPPPPRDIELSSQCGFACNSASHQDHVVESGLTVIFAVISPVDHM